MFSPKIVASDAFLDMPTSSRELYFQLGMYADDDGFVNPRKIIRMVGASEDDLKVLVGKRFVIPFENGVVVIKHWAINNLIRKDWYQPSIYSEQKKRLIIKENGSYTEKDKEPVNKLLTEVSLGKVSLGKDTKIAPETAAYSFEEEIKKLLGDSKEHIRIIGMWIEERKLRPENRAQIQSIIKRNVRAASLLCGYDEKYIRYTVSALRHVDYLKKFTLETVAKYIDEMMDKQKKAGPKVLRWELHNGAMRPIY